MLELGETLGEPLLLVTALLLRVELTLPVSDCRLLAVALDFGDREDDSVTLDEPLLLVTALLLRVALLLCVPLMEALLLRVALPHVDALMVALAERDSEGDAVSVLGAL